MIQRRSHPRPVGRWFRLILQIIHNNNRTTTEECLSHHNNISSHHHHHNNISSSSNLHSGTSNHRHLKPRLPISNNNNTNNHPNHHTHIINHRHLNPIKQHPINKLHRHNHKNLDTNNNSSSSHKPPCILAPRILFRGSSTNMSGLKRAGGWLHSCPTQHTNPSLGK